MGRIAFVCLVALGALAWRAHQRRCRHRWDVAGARWIYDQYLPAEWVCRDCGLRLPAW